MKVEDRKPPFYLGIDLGGTNIKSGVVDDDGRPISSVSLPTEAHRGPEVGLANIAEAGRKAVEMAGIAWGEIRAVGLGSPGPMDIKAGKLLTPPNLPGWAGFEIRDRLADALKVPVVFQNDANAAAYGEFWVGAGREAASLVLFTLGTGIGCGVVEEGEILEGRHSHGGECGHMIIALDGRVCSCGRKGHLEAYASATSLVKRAVEALDAGEQSSLTDVRAKGTLSSLAIDEAARAGDLLADRLMRETARYLAVGAVDLMHTIDPDIILFSGGMIAAGATFLEQIRANVHDLALPIPAAKTRIEYAALGGDAGFIGAAGWARKVTSSPG